MKKLYIQITIVLLLLYALYYVFSQYKSEKKYDIEIKRLNSINDSLIIANHKIEIQTSIYLQQNKIKETIIKGLMNRDSILQNKISDISISLKKIKNKYEQANNRSININSNDIQRYFSNLQ